jgi:thiosulfate/3-mercaptopyruvate sulfurtransferase
MQTQTNADFKELDWLIAHLDDPRLRIIDARSLPAGGVVSGPSGRELYAAGHLPGAVYLDYNADLSDPATPHATRVAPAERFAAVMAAHGIGDDAIVIAYDAGTTPFAARMVWMLQFYGHREAYVLAGGIGAWTAAGRALSTDVPTPQPATFTPREQPALRASLDEVRGIAEGRSDEQLIETQRDQTYAQRDRDIPNATRISGNLLLEDANGGRVADGATLAALVDGARLDRSKRTVVTCGSGVSASGAWIALRAAGFTDIAVYDGSWTEWSHHDLPTVPKKPAG